MLSIFRIQIISFVKKNKYLTLFLIFILAIPFVFSFFKKGVDSDDKDYTDFFQRKYSVFALNIPNNLSFAGENVPLDHFDVREALDQEMLVNTYWQSQTLLFIKRAKRYFPEIEPILKKNNIPDDFKYLVLAESDLKNVVSPSGAVGVWQLLEGTAKDHGLEVNDNVDERYHIEKATEVACDFLLKSKELFGSWTMAAASYNMGRTGLLKQVKRQGQSDYYNLLLNDETARYIYRILAIKLILENPQDYGFYLREKDMYYPVPTYTIKVDSSISDFALFSEKYNINYKILKHFNPWLRDSFLDNKRGKEYLIKIPENGYRSYSKISDQIKFDTTFVAN
ncbi:MAG: murein transglycosylase [Bacteroidetes bacterium GWC2_33_15]|nr:MAG: murein transglycosylase [Bacteroidetes bacterium GWA2_33_15]OFX50482.1 MAG: murein transglycosylase [Bacteroidetes bacterium GWC2_33_15]OFX66600.1 MAG: murein transglycosylase [Bacteroidetes bacterium GWB2_32_14]OFX69218.1 MAG: murein transglycosylase [Bacteroidetes bacterium GWD2_33_33]HAN18528.1 murein transglycosylase [Bacteroidales bacterium]